MTVRVTNLYSDGVESFSGDEREVADALRRKFEWLEEAAPSADLATVVKLLRRVQALKVEVLP